VFGEVNAMTLTRARVPARDWRSECRADRTPVVDWVAFTPEHIRAGVDLLFRWSSSERSERIETLSVVE